jgi:probable HAF family extracellular repeat protein
MHRLSLLIGLVVLVVAAAMVMGPVWDGDSASAQGRWVITDLGTLGGRTSWAHDINGRGQVVGESDTGVKRGKLTVRHAFLWENGRMRNLGGLGGNSRASAINDRGEIVGASVIAGCVTEHAVLWKNGKIRDLNSGDYAGATYAIDINERGQIIAWYDLTDCDGTTHMYAFGFVWQSGSRTSFGAFSPVDAINNRGQVIGTDQETGPSRAFVWEHGKTTLLGSGAKPSFAAALNEHGQIVGDSGVDAVLWEGGKTSTLGILPGKKWSRSVAINERSEVVGYSFGRGPRSFDINGDLMVIPVDPSAFLWKEGRIHRLGTLPGTVFSRPVALNDRGQVVGVSYRRSQSGEPVDPRAFVWESGRMTELPPLPGGRTCAPTAINEHNQIVGSSGTKTGNRHAVLWTLRLGS